MWLVLADGAPRAVWYPEQLSARLGSVAGLGAGAGPSSSRLEKAASSPDPLAGARLALCPSLAEGSLALEAFSPKEEPSVTGLNRDSQD